MKKFLINNIFGISMAVILTVSTTVAFAKIIAASDVQYDNSKSSLQSNNVQDAIDELFDKSNNSPACKEYEPLYMFGDPLSDWSSSSDQMALYTKYVGLDQFVCLNLSYYYSDIDMNTCFDPNDIENEKIHMQDVFESNGGSCYEYNSVLYCSYEATPYLYCRIQKNWIECSLDGDSECTAYKDYERYGYCYGISS